MYATKIDSQGRIKIPRDLIEFLPELKKNKKVAILLPVKAEDFLEIQPFDLEKLRRQERTILATRKLDTKDRICLLNLYKNH